MTKAKALTLSIGTISALALPLVSFAAINNISDVGTFIITTINNVIVPVLFSIAFIVFLYGVFEVFILGANDEEKKGQGRNLILWGLIGFFVMVSVWGLVNILTGTFVLGNNSGVQQPTSGSTIGQ